MGLETPWAVKAEAWSPSVVPCDFPQKMGKDRRKEREKSKYHI